ncbi:MAG: class II aldolase/adducin family protein [Chloroflexota bacterium]
MASTPFTDVAQARRKLAQIGALLFERRLTDAAGGNISTLVGDVVVMSPSLSGSKRQWQLHPDDVMVVDLEGNILEGDGTISRESNVHFGLYKTFGEYGTAVIHAHPHNVMPFCAAAMSIPPVLEANLKFGEVPCIEYAPAHSQQLADNVVNAIRGNEAKIQKQAAGVVAPWHGIFLIGKDLDAAFDAVERFDTNARSILMAPALGVTDQLSVKRNALVKAASAHGKSGY